MGLSFLLPEEVSQVRVIACWGDYRAVYAETPEETPLLADPASEEEEGRGGAGPVASEKAEPAHRLAPLAAIPKPFDVTLPADGTAEIPNSQQQRPRIGGRRFANTTLREPGGDRAARSVSLFMVNRRAPLKGRRADERLGLPDSIARGERSAVHRAARPAWLSRNGC